MKKILLKETYQNLMLKPKLNFQDVSMYEILGINFRKMKTSTVKTKIKKWIQLIKCIKNKQNNSHRKRNLTKSKKEKTLINN